jgi:hypothetical protein
MSKLHQQAASRMQQCTNPFALEFALALKTATIYCIRHFNNTTE